MKMSMKFVYGLMVASALAAAPAHALTFKKGQVLGSDGEVYDGASPEQQAALVEQSKQEGWFGKKKTSGVQGSNLYIVLEDDLVFVPLNELKGKSKEALKETVKQHIVDHLTANLKEFYTEGGQLDQEGFESGLANASGEATNQVAAEAARIAEYDAEAAAAFVEASLDLATAADEASRAAAEQALEAVVESAAVQESIQATVEEMNISEELATEIVENDSYYKDANGNFISEAEARDQGLIE